MASDYNPAYLYEAISFQEVQKPLEDFNHIAWFPIDEAIEKLKRGSHKWGIEAWNADDAGRQGQQHDLHIGHFKAVFRGNGGKGHYGRGNGRTGNADSSWVWIMSFPTWIYSDRKSVV